MLHVGISGPIASGKTTLAQKLLEMAQNEGYAATIASFATGIREIIAMEQMNGRVTMLALLLSKWGCDSTEAHMTALAIDQAMTTYPSTPGVKNRRLLQTIGTEIGRNMLSPNIWIYRTQQVIKEQPFVDFAFSDDLRFDNEVMAVDVHIAILPNECYEQRKEKYGMNYIYTNHASEQSLTLPPLLTIPACFTDVQGLFYTLNRIRELRYDI